MSQTKRPQSDALRRRQLLCAAIGATLLSACGGPKRSEVGPTASLRPGSVTRVAYGGGPAQFGYLALPKSPPLGTVVLIHGGAWSSRVDFRVMLPIARVLLGTGIATWTIEYRRLQDGGGWPNTFVDVAAAIDRLETLSDWDSSPEFDVVSHRVAILGHSAGGHLAVWAASRRSDTPGGTPAVPVRGAVSLSGVLDLTAAIRSSLSASVRSLVGGTPGTVPGHYRLADPSLLVPSRAPIWAIHARNDELVPPTQSIDYVAANRAAGGEAQLVLVPGTHNTIADPQYPSWPRIVSCIGSALGVAIP